MNFVSNNTGLPSVSNWVASRVTVDPGRISLLPLTESEYRAREVQREVMLSGSALAVVAYNMLILILA
jgi:hypothetical protein